MEPSSPDIGLLVACFRYGFARQEVACLEAGNVSDARLETAVDSLDSAAYTVAGLKARTVEGLRTKAVVCRLALAADEPDGTVSPPVGLVPRHDALLWSLASDLLACLRSPSSPDPDAELLAACAAFDATEHHRNAMFDGGVLTDEADVTLRAEQDRRMERICTLRALTPRGWKARARSLLLVDGEFLERRPVNSNDRMMAAILRDLVESDPAEPAASTHPACDCGASTS